MIKLVPQIKNGYKSKSYNYWHKLVAGWRGVLFECLENPKVEAVLVISKNPMG